MKNNSYFVSNQPFPRRLRAQIFELLGGKQEALEDLEFAANLYFSESGLKDEKPKQINQDAKDLAEAIKTIDRLVNESGIAIAVFKGNGGKEAFSLVDAFCYDKGASLADAAQETICDTKPLGGRPPERERASRITLVRQTAAIAKRVGITPSRTAGDFPNLIMAIYEATGIDVDHSDRDIREYLESES